jgi:succinyl-CoA synthetase beta subunit
MNIHEYQAKQLLARNGVAVPFDLPAKSLAEVRPAAEKIAATGSARVVVKSQIHAGGRGKGTFKSGFQGGVKVAASVDEAVGFAEQMLGQTLVTKQTGPEGRRVQTLLLAEGAKIKKEFYLAVLLDRANSRPLIMASTEGGMDIEEVAEKHPEKIFREHIDPAVGIMPFQARKISAALGLKGDLFNAGVKLITGVFNTWWECDATMVELNPLAIVELRDGKEAVLALDAKISLDDNALYRHKDIQEMRDLNEEAPLEIEASKFNLNYIKLDGSIACLVNGAGLAMATMDIIQHFGGSPANFLDVGGGASKEQVTAAFKIILSDPNVKGILVNIFGGIMDCNVIATGIVAAVKETGLKLPLVVRLEGNNVAAGKQTLAESGVAIITGDSMADAARKVVKAVGNHGSSFNATEIAFTCYPVTDMARARKFYETVLSLKATTAYGSEGGMQWTEYDIASGTLALGCGAPDWRPREDGAAVALEVEDFEQAIAHLRATNAKFKIEPMASPVCHMAFIYDTEGNLICIHKRRKS